MSSVKRSFQEETPLEDFDDNEAQHFKSEHSHRILQKLFLSEDTADVYFEFRVCGKLKRIPAHKNILAEGSPVFKLKFYGDHANEGDIKITEVSAEAFIEFLRFFYSDRVKISARNVAELMVLANRYEVSDCLEVCDRFLSQNLPLEKICFFYDLAITVNRPSLKKLCERKISEEPKLVFATNGFRRCSVNVLRHILEIDYLFCDALEVFQACLIWARNSCEKNNLDASKMANRRRQLGDCFYHIPFYVMTFEQITMCVQNYKELFDRDELAEIMVLMTTNSFSGLSKFKYSRQIVYVPSNGWSSVAEFSAKNSKWVEQQEIVPYKFSSPVRMVAIKPFLVLAPNVEEIDSNEPIYLSGTMTFVTKDGVHEEILLRQQINIECRRISFPPPIIKLDEYIVCDPNRSYELRFAFDDSWRRHKFYTTKTTADEPSNIVSFVCCDPEVYN